MLISGILKDAFNGTQLTFKNYNLYKEFEEVTQDVQFGFGNENELARFIENRSNMQNFPLIWYVKPNYSRDTALIEKFRVNAKFVLMMSTDAKYYNDERSLINYENVLEPLAVEFYKRIKKHKLISLVSESSNEYDETQYGLDVYRSEQGQTKSATKLYVDAKIIEIELLVKKNCGAKVRNIEPPIEPPVFVCENGNKYIQIQHTFNNPFTPSLQTKFKDFTSLEITEMWLNNNDYACGIGGLNIFICTDRFEIGSTVRFSNNSETMPNNSIWNGYYIANQTGYSGNATLNGVEIEHRFNPNRSCPYGATNPITNPPLPLNFWADTVEPVIIKIEGGLVTEIIQLPMTGFAYEEPEPVENIPCSSEGRYYYQLLDKFNLNNVPINIRALSASEITNMWLDNENYTSGIGQSGIAKCNQNFSLGDKIYVSSYDLNILPSTLNGYWLADPANEYITYGVIQGEELKNITTRLAPTRTSISPVVIKAVSPKIVKIIDGIVTEVINVPTTGFSKSNI